MADQRPEDWDRLVRRLATAGKGALYKGLEDLVSWLEKYKGKPLSYRSLHLAEAEYDAMLERQGGVCAICKGKSSGRLVVDHDHATGNVRGLLCGSCNLALGLLRDDRGRLRAAMAYLEETPKTP